MKKTIIALALAIASFAARADQFAVQVGSFATQAEAQGWIAKMVKIGVPAYAETRGDKVLLRAGPFENKDEAQAAIAKIRAAGFEMASDPVQPKATPSSDTPYVASMRAKYAQNIHYDSAQSKQVIKNLNIDCHSQDGRVLPFENVMLASAASMNGFVEFYVQRAEGETRVVEAAKGQEEGHVFLTINKWGEIQSDKAEPIMNACFGSYGPIWTAKK